MRGSLSHMDTSKLDPDHSELACKLISGENGLGPLTQANSQFACSLNVPGLIHGEGSVKCLSSMEWEEGTGAAMTKEQATNQTTSIECKGKEG